MSFASFDLDPSIVKAIEEAGYSHPTPIQKEAIPSVLSGRDLLAAAQTGTGKTAAYTLPLLQRLLMMPKVEETMPIRALILTPTRELAVQVAASVEAYAKYLPLESTVIYGGVGINPQIKRIKAGVDILIATPGRLLDLLDKEVLSLSMLECFVLDEADRMLDMGFVKDIKKLRKQMSNRRQNLLFSATFSKEVKALAHEFLNDPEVIEANKANRSAQSVNQVVYPVDCNRKSHLLIKLIQDHDWHQVLVFVRTKEGANQLVKKLRRADITAEAIHGNKGQATRMQLLERFKAKEIRILVATDLASRGIDIDQLPRVINYELPNHPEDYVHRIGRSGRAGHAGEAASLVCIDEQNLLNAIEKFIKQRIEVVEVAEFKPDPKKEVKPIDLLAGSRKSTKNSHSRWRGNRRGGRPVGNGSQSSKKHPKSK